MRYTIAHSWTRVRKMQPLYFTKQSQAIPSFGQTGGKGSYVREIERSLSQSMQSDYVLIAVGEDNPLICYTPESNGFVVVGPTECDLGENAAFFDGMKRLCDVSNIPVRTLFSLCDEICRKGWSALRSDEVVSWIMDEKGKKFIEAVLSFSGCEPGVISVAEKEREPEQRTPRDDDLVPASEFTQTEESYEDWEALSDADELAALDMPLGEIVVTQTKSLDQGKALEKQHVHKTPPHVLSKNLTAVRDIIQEFSRDISFQIQSGEGALPVRSDVVLEVKGILPAILIHAFLIWLPISLTEKRSGFSLRIETDESAYLGYKITDLNTPDTMFLVLAVSEAMTTIIGMNECELSFSLTAMRNWLKRYGYPTQSIDNLIG